jgi:hypothetical protein
MRGEEVATRSFNVMSYSVSLTRELGWNINGTGVIHSASIRVQGQAAEEFLIIGFLPDDEAIPADADGFIFRPQHEYLWYIDLLRNERPITAIRHENPAFNEIYTGPEPPGESEVPRTP